MLGTYVAKGAFDKMSHYLSTTSFEGWWAGTLLMSLEVMMSKEEQDRMVFTYDP